jgi:hypothetical protein
MTDIHIHSGDMITIQWSGELRTVVLEVRDGEVFLRDLTSAEQQQMDDEAARDEAARWEAVSGG